MRAPNKPAPANRAMAVPLASWSHQRPYEIELAIPRCSPYPVPQTGLRALDPEASYRVDFIDESYANTQRTLSGKDLMSGFELPLPKKATSLLIRYSRLRG